MMAAKQLYVVDDDEDFRNSLVFYLTAAGFLVIEMESGRQLLELLKTSAPGCVLLDLRMPDMDGFEVLDRLRGFKEDFPTVVMTGHGDIASAVRAMKLGAADFIEKPFDEMMLLETLAKAEAEVCVEGQPVQRVTDSRVLIGQLTTREADVLRGLLDGLPNKLIAFRLGISVRTVEMHRANMMNRLHAKSLSDALRIAHFAGF